MFRPAIALNVSVSMSLEGAVHGWIQVERFVSKPINAVTGCSASPLRRQKTQFQKVHCRIWTDVVKRIVPAAFYVYPKFPTEFCNDDKILHYCIETTHFHWFVWRNLHYSDCWSNCKLRFHNPRTTNNVWVVPLVERVSKKRQTRYIPIRWRKPDICSL